MLKYLWLSLIVIILDQLSKQLAEHYLVFQVAIPVIPSFNLTLSYNTGAAFSFLRDAGGWQRWMFTGLALVVSVVIVIWLRKLPKQDKWVAIALSLVLGGALGNVIDRILFGHVIDFIQVYYQQYYWPIFNIADSAISIGVVILLIDGLFGGKDKDKEQTS